MRNILIIGANGFTGRQLLKDLSAHKQYNVTGCSLHSDIFPALENTRSIVSLKLIYEMKRP